MTSRTGLAESAVTKRWGLALLCVLGYAALSLVPLPVSHLLGETGADPRFDSMPTLAGGSIYALLPIRLILSVLSRENARARVVAFFVFLSVVLVQAWSIAQWIASVTSVGLFVDSTLGTRALVLGPMLAAAAAIWFLADAISRSRVGSGAAVLGGLTVLVHMVRGALETAQHQSRFDPPASYVFAMTPLVAIAIVLLGLVWFGSGSWPRFLFDRIEVISPLDVVCCVAIIATGHGTIVNDLVGVYAPFYGQWLNVLAAILAATASVFWLRSRRGERQSSKRFIMPAALAFVLALVPLLGLRVPSIPVDPRFSGDEDVALTLHSSRESDNSQDVAIIQQRLHSYGVEFESESSSNTLSLVLHKVRNVDDLVREITDRSTLNFRLIAQDQQALGQTDDNAALAGASCCVDRHRDGIVAWAGPTRESLAPVIDLLDATHRADVAVECAPEHGPSACSAYLLEAPIVTQDDVVSAELAMDAQTSRPYVSVHLSASAATRFEEATGASMGRALAIVVNDTILSAPRIVNRIPGGHLAVSPGAADPETQLREMTLLARVLASRHLQAQWSRPED